MALRQTLSTGTSESSIIFFNGVHNHNGVSSALIDVSKYSLYDLTTDFLGTSARQTTQAFNYGKFKEVISRIVKEDVLTIAGIKLLPNEVKAENITAGAITADKLSANIVLINNVISSNNFNGTVLANGTITAAGTTGWAVSGQGQAVFDTTFIRGSLSASEVLTPGVDIYSNGTLAGGSFVLYGNGAIITSGGNFSVDVYGQVYAESATIRGEISSETYVTHNRYGVDANYTRPTVLIDNANNEFSLNSAGGGIRLEADQWLAYRSGDSFYRMNFNFSTSNFYLLGNFEVDGGITSYGELQGDYGNITGSGILYQTSNLMPYQSQGVFPIAFCYRIAGGRYYLIANNDTNTLGTINWTPSDRRIKENISPISSDILDKFYSINVYKFNWNDQAPSFLDRGLINVGVIADELKGIIPDAVDDFSPEGEENNRWATVEYEKIVPYTIAAIQDLNSKIQALEARIAELEG